MGEFREPNGVVSSSASLSGCVLREEVWARAEGATREIIRKVQPTVVSEERRKDVIDYVQRLLKFNLGCEVFPFGSVPLRTYLPDGDVDLTAFCSFNLEESFALEVHSVLEREDHNPCAEFVVKDVQYICAELKLVKCLVQNIAVDISFNQIGGLCTLCFLEEVDRLIGKDHLFKRSIILIKAWCYYESRILGAHHGLISTYALETLVLYIFHLFHSSLTGPLAVLYKFLDYFSKFDWENYCVSLSGPVNLKSLPEIVARTPKNEGGELLLSHDFMSECVRKFSVSCKGTDTNSRTFMKKHLNIVDPLKANNNLGRSVSKGNFFRIRSAFTYGARKLGQILSQPQNKIAEEVQRFFTDTVDRHGQGHRPDVQGMLVASFLFSQEESFIHEIEPVYPNDGSSEYRVVSEDTRHGLSSNAFERETYLGEAGVEEASESSSSMDEETKFPSLPHHHLSNGKLGNNGLHENVPSYSHSMDGDANSMYCNNRSSRNDGSHGTPKILPDLSGDVVSHLDSLRHGQWWYECDQFLTAFHPVHPGPPFFHRKSQWDPTGHFRRDMVPRPPFFPPHVVAGPTFVDEIPKPRGTGTYFPITNHHSYRDRPSLGRGRNQGQLKSPRTNGRAPTPPHDRSPQAQSPGRQDSYGSSPRGKVFKGVNGFGAMSEKDEKFIAQEHPTPVIETPLPEGESNLPSSDPSPPGSLNGEPVFVKNDRLGVQSYHLVDNEDFPPLSS